MSLIYEAELVPSKMELLAGWVPLQPWFEGEAGTAFTNVAAFRFDDPVGEVGIETLLVRAGEGPVLQVPVTYRGSPIAGADDFLIGMTQHSVLGELWVYDGVGDPAWIAATTDAIIFAGHQTELWVDTEGELVLREPNAWAIGSGATIAGAVAGNLVLNRHPEESVIDPGFGALTGSWAGHPEQATFVTLA